MQLESYSTTPGEIVRKPGAYLLPVPPRILFAFALVVSLAGILEHVLPQLGDLELLSLAAPALWSFLCVRPTREWPIFTLSFILILSILPWAVGVQHLPLAIALVEAGEALAIAGLLRRWLTPARLAEKSALLLVYTGIVATICFFGGVFAGAFLRNPDIILIWWLRDLCGYVALAGPLWCLASRRSQGLLEDLGGRQQRTQFAVLLGLFMMLMMPAVFLLMNDDGSSAFHHLRLAALLLPLPVAIVLADMFLGLGAASAMLLFAPVAIETASRSSDKISQMLPVLMFVYAFLTVLSLTMFLVASRRRQLRAALFAARDALEMQDRFFARMNHELRTPLNAILGFSEMQRMRCRSSSKNGYAANIHSSGQRLMAMVEGAIDHGIVGGPGSLNKQHLEIGPRVAAVAGMLTDPRLTVTCDIDLQALGSLHLEADPDVLDAVFQCLLAPARRACGPLTTVRLSSGVEDGNFVLTAEHSYLHAWRSDQRDQMEWERAHRGALAHGARISERTDGKSLIREVTVYAVATAC